MNEICGCLRKWKISTFSVSIRRIQWCSFTKLECFSASEITRDKGWYQSQSKLQTNIPEVKCNHTIIIISSLHQNNQKTWQGEGRGDADVWTVISPKFG